MEVAEVMADKNPTACESIGQRSISSTPMNIEFHAHVRKTGLTQRVEFEGICVDKSNLRPSRYQLSPITITSKRRG